MSGSPRHAGGDCVTVREWLKNAEFSCQPEPVRETTLNPAAYMDEISIPSREGTLRYDNGPSKRVNVTAGLLSRSRSAEG